MRNPDSYVAASRFPWKVIQQRDKILRPDWSIRPYHLQFMPTNRCNANCSWCSCSEVDRKVEMSLEESREMLTYFATLGMKAVTITGGGEPSIHPHIAEIVEHCQALRAKVGIVTNGKVWSKVSNDDLKWLNRTATWMRISIIDTVGAYDTSIVPRVCVKVPGVDVGISFTVTPNINLTTATDICRLAEELPNITHIRFVDDILNPTFGAMERVKKHCQELTSKAIFQGRTDFTRGAKSCLISMLKPVVDASGYVYPCCGVQYASEDTRRLPEAYRMCHWRDFHKAKNFDGSGCIKCYYDDYNTTLVQLTRKFEHEEFV